MQSTKQRETVRLGWLSIMPVASDRCIPNLLNKNVARDKLSGWHGLSCNYQMVHLEGRSSRSYRPC
ncbi:hypothetical protein RE6C_02647 [Rhodopirellula europaea 6C]|uniref:Uncharacterized protein n=1 Tax=Rhodopirellula europaea 6C TaxID=1263867 RepID=M2A6R5_9BACT|nr:hypothetical protein RE6C_02647 [Rhodopirellula europaea 6C]